MNATAVIEYILEDLLNLKRVMHYESSARIHWQKGGFELEVLIKST